MIESVVFELSAIVDYRGSSLRYANGFVSFFHCVRDFNTALISLLPEKEAGTVIDGLKLRELFFNGRIYNMQWGYSKNLDDKSEIDEQIRKLFVRTAISSRFNLQNSLIVTGDYHVYKAVLTCELPCIVIRSDIEDRDYRFTEALYSYRTYDYIEDVFPLFFNR